MKLDRLSTLFRHIVTVPLYVWHYAIAPLFGAHCRFYPSCSEYACKALHRHGVIQGSWLSIKRVSRCHSLCSGGIDFVP